MQIWWRQLAESLLFKTSVGFEGGGGFKWLNVVNMVVCAWWAPGLSVFTNCSSTGIFATSRHTRGFAEDGLKKNVKYPVRFGAKCLADVRGQRSERVKTTEKQQELSATTGCHLLVSNSAEYEHLRPWSFMYLERRTCVVLIKWPVSVHFDDCNKLSQFLFVLLVLRRLWVSCKVLFLLPALKSLTALGSCCPAFTHLHTPRLTSAFLLTHKSITSSFLLHADGIILLPGLLGNSNTFCCFFFFNSSHCWTLLHPEQRQMY